MNSTNELASFLKNAKVVVKNLPEAARIHVVIGNESADLDSFVSAVVYAFYLSKLPQNPDECVQYVPVVSIHQDDLALRTDIIALLDKLKMSTNEFVYLSDVDFISLPIKKVTLVDHNNRAKHLKEISDYVCQIIDHHEDSEDFQNIAKNIKTVGSCATLLTEEIYYSQHSVLSIYPIADLLLSAVLIDTYNLDLHSGRTTELDIFMGEILTNHTSEDPDELFDYLQKAKMNISSMNTFNILRKDYKSVSASLKMGISSATILSLSVLSRDDFLQATKEYMCKVQIDVLIIMFLSFKENSTFPFREIAVVTMDTVKLEMVSSYLISFKNDLIEGIRSII